jgi:peptide/nickel transport system ATP-binding protein
VLADDAPLLGAHGLSRRFPGPPPGALARLRGTRAATVHAVEDVTLSIAPHEALGLVGESGCGKSTLGRMLAGILPPSAGEVRWQGRPVAGLRGPAARAWTLGVQMVFQDPQASLNPRRRVAELVGEAPALHGLTPRRDVRAYVADILQEVGLDPGPALDRLPHQFSGGQRQRIGIARALAVRPAALVCDEAVSALDVSVQAQVINLLADLRARRGLALLFISHDLSVVRHLSDRVAVMYLGRIVEEAPAARLFAAPAHPYTAALLRQMPRLEPGRKRFDALPGELPSALRPPPGCAFHPRCPHVFDRCRAERPLLQPVAPGQQAACHLHGRMGPDQP